MDPGRIQGDGKHPQNYKNNPLRQLQESKINTGNSGKIPIYCKSIQRLTPGHHVRSRQTQRDSDRPKNTQTHQMNPDKPRQTQTNTERLKQTQRNSGRPRQTQIDPNRRRYSLPNQLKSRPSKINSYKTQKKPKDNKKKHYRIV